MDKEKQVKITIEDVDNEKREFETNNAFLVCLDDLGDDMIRMQGVTKCNSDTATARKLIIGILTKVNELIEEIRKQEKNA